MNKWEILFDRFWDRLELYVEKYAPVFVMISMFYLTLIFVVSYLGR